MVKIGCSSEILGSFFRSLIPNLLSFAFAWLPYLLFGGFIMGWWTLVFHKTSSPSVVNTEISQALALENSVLLKELSPLQRSDLQRALAGHFSLMLKFIDQWDKDTLLLINKGIKGIKRLSKEKYLQAHILGYLIQQLPKESLHELNCKMNLEWIYDDSGQQLHINDTFKRFLPQTYIAASFLLAIAHPSEIVALPKGLRQLTQLYPTNILKQVCNDIDCLHSEELYLNKPDLAFVAPYSHPSALESLRNQNIQFYSLKHINTIQEIQEALLKIGHTSNHILEAQLLTIFMEAGFLSLDNRLLAMQQENRFSQALRRCLYLCHHQNYALPTTKCLTGQLMVRALKHCPHLLGFIPESQEEWSIPFEQEQILQTSPDIIIISTPSLYIQKSMDIALYSTEAFKNQRVFYIDEAAQESPTQYVVLAYFDLVQALITTYCL